MDSLTCRQCEFAPLRAGEYCPRCGTKAVPDEDARVQSTRETAKAPAASVPPPSSYTSSASASLGPALLAGATAGILGGLIWGWIAEAIGGEIGYAAWVLGGICGIAVALAHKGFRDGRVQAIAVIASLLGIFVGNYYIFTSALRQAVLEEYGEAGGISMFSGDAFSIFMENIGAVLSGYDLIWVGLAVLTAWRITARGIDI